MNRQRLILTSLVLAGTLPNCSSKESATRTQDDKRHLVVVSYGGGAYQQSHIKAFTKPFEATSKTRVESVVWGAEYGKLSEMVRVGRPPWDVVEVTAAQFRRGLSDGLFAPITVTIDSSVFRPIAGGPKPTASGVPNVYWSTVLAFDPKAVKGPLPQNWKDFWDVKKYPGPRALYDSPRGTLEFALLAAGVPKEKLYPLNVDRAFRMLDQLRPHVKVWWSDGAEPVTLLLTGQVAMTSAWSGRIFASQTARERIRYRWQGAANELDYWIIPKGSANAQLASEFIRFASSPEPMAKQAVLTAYGPTNSLALDKIPPDYLQQLPTAPKNWALSFVVNSDWWAMNEQSVTERWLRWKNK